jgi:Tol biopolymer transport system component
MVWRSGKMTVHRLALLLFLLSCVAAPVSSASASGVTERVSVSSAGAQGNIGSWRPSISADGRHVAFESYATNLVSGDTNNQGDIFVRDRLLGTTERVSVSSAGAEANNSNYYPSISADGGHVAWESCATNLVSGDTNNEGDIFVRDRLLGTTERASVSSAGAEANDYSESASISADGRCVAFHSFATNLVPGDTNGWPDVFVRDRLLGTTERVSVNSAGAQANFGSYYPSISADGRYVAFASSASNLVEGDNNGVHDVFVRDRLALTTERVSVSSAETEGNDGSFSYTCPISADGRHAAFWSRASNLVAGDTNGVYDVFVRDRLTGNTGRVSLSSAGAEGNGDSGYLSISADGRYVAFHSFATNLVPGDTNGWSDVFVRDRLAASTKRVSVSSAGAEANSNSQYPSISADGGYVAFHSWATNLVAGDTNADVDVFVRSALTYPVPEVLLEVHPNERAPGSTTAQSIGGNAWIRPAHVPGAMYWWKHYRFVGSDALWIQVCAQNWNATQNGTGDDDNIRMRIDGFVPVDYDLIQNGPWGAYQWRGSKENGHRWTLRFLYLGASPLPVLHALQFEADETPALWWIKVTDLEPGVIEAF